jgi:hypothetical protein
MDIERDTTVISSMVGNGKSPQEMAHFTGNIIELPFGKRLQFVTENGHRNSEFPMKHGDFPYLCSFTGG